MHSLVFIFLIHTQCPLPGYIKKITASKDIWECLPGQLLQLWVHFIQ